MEWKNKIKAYFQLVNHHEHRILDLKYKEIFPKYLNSALKVFVNVMIVIFFFNAGHDLHFHFNKLIGISPNKNNTSYWSTASKM